MSDLSRFISRVEGGRMRSTVTAPVLKPQPDADLPARLLVLDVWFYNEDGSLNQFRSYGVDQFELVGRRIANWTLYGMLE